MAGSLASLPALRVLLNLELVLNLTQKARSECSPHAEGIQAGEAGIQAGEADIQKARKPEPSEWYRVVQKRSRKSPGTLTWSQLSRVRANRLSGNSAPAF